MSVLKVIKDWIVVSICTLLRSVLSLHFSDVLGSVCSMVQWTSIHLFISLLLLVHFLIVDSVYVLVSLLIGGSKLSFPQIRLRTLVFIAFADLVYTLAIISICTNYKCTSCSSDSFYSEMEFYLFF